MRNILYNIIGLLLLFGIITFEYYRKNTSVLIFEDEFGNLAFGRQVDGDKSGQWIFTDSLFNLFAVGSYAQDKMNGVWRQFYNDSALTLSLYSIYKNGLNCDYALFYDRSGVIQTKYVYNESITSRVIEYHQNDSTVSYPNRLLLTNIPEIYSTKSSTSYEPVGVSRFFLWIKFVIIFALLVVNMSQFLAKKSPPATRLL